MKFKIVSAKRNKTKLIVGIFPLILFPILLTLDIEGIYINKILLGASMLYLLLPISILKNKYIGDFELTNQYISFITERREYVKLGFSEILHCKLSYIGVKGNINWMAGGWSWESGLSFFELQTKETVYKIIFLSESLEDENNLIKYIEVLKANDIAYFFSFKGIKYTSKELQKFSLINYFRKPRI